MERLSDDSIHVVAGSFQRHGQRDWWFERPLLADAAHLFIKASLYLVVFLPADQTARSATIKTVEELLQLRVLRDQLSDPGVFKSLAQAI